VINISKRYGSSYALKDLSLKIFPKEFVILVGPSGAGKSTLIKLLIKEEKPTKGKVFVAGRDVTKLNYYELPYYRRNIGIVFQDYKLFSSKTTYENIAYVMEVMGASEKNIERDVCQVLELVGLTEKACNFSQRAFGGRKTKSSYS